MAHEFVVKEVRGFEKALPKSFNVFYASRQGGGGEPHHWILKEREVPHDPVVGTKRDVKGHLRRERKDERPKVDRSPKVPREDGVRKDHVVARRHVVADLSMFKAETSRPRDDVENAVFADDPGEFVDGIVEVEKLVLSRLLCLGILICDGFVDGSGERGLDLFGRGIFEK